MAANHAENSRLERRIDIVVRLLALSLFKEEQTLKDRAVLLQKAGLEAAEIAELCGTTRNTVSVALSNAKKGGKRKKGK